MKYTKPILIMVGAVIVYGALAIGTYLLFGPGGLPVPKGGRVYGHPIPVAPPLSMVFPDEPTVWHWVVEDDGKHVLYGFRQSEIRR